jgi:hypothetical protein
MRRRDAAALEANRKPLSTAVRHDAAAQLVCLALTIALIALAWRIFEVL